MKEGMDELLRSIEELAGPDAGIGDAITDSKIKTIIIKNVEGPSPEASGVSVEPKLLFREKPGTAMQRNRYQLNADANEFFKGPKLASQQ